MSHHTAKFLCESKLNPIGKGAFARVYSGTCRVLKLGNEPHDDGWVEYAKLVMKHHSTNPFAPRIYSFRTYSDFYVAKMERLDFRYADVIREQKFSISHRDYIAKLYENCNEFLWGYGEEHLDVLPDQLALLLIDIKSIIDQRLAGNDLHHGNIMFRGEQLVITDPLA